MASKPFVKMAAVSLMEVCVCDLGGVCGGCGEGEEGVWEVKRVCGR